MIIKSKNKYREYIVNKVSSIIYRIENIGNEYFESNGELDFIKNISKYYKDKITFFDIGANIGEYASAIKENRSNCYDYYHLFEPQKSCLEELRGKFKNDNTIILNNIALSDSKTEAIIYKNAEMSGLTSLYKRDLKFYNLEMDYEERVEIDTAFNYIENNKIYKINLVKIDVEGNEIKTLNGFGKYLDRNFIDFIQFEYGGANLDSHTTLMDLYSLLEPKGFEICKIMKKHLEHRKYNPRFENFVNQNYVAVSKNIFHSLVSK